MNKDLVTLMIAATFLVCGTDQATSQTLVKEKDIPQETLKSHIPLEKMVKSNLFRGKDIFIPQNGRKSGVGFSKFHKNSYMTLPKGMDAVYYIEKDGTPNFILERRLDRYRAQEAYTKLIEMLENPKTCQKMNQEIANGKMPILSHDDKTCNYTLIFKDWSTTEKEIEYTMNKELIKRFKKSSKKDILTIQQI